MHSRLRPSLIKAIGTNVCEVLESIEELKPQLQPTA